MSCDDLDECAAGTADCDPRATCTNLADGAGYECECTAMGYTGDGFFCTDVDECVLEASLSTLSAALSGGSSTRLAKLSANAIEHVRKADAQAIQAAAEKLLSSDGPLTVRFFIDDCALAPDRPRIRLICPTRSLTSQG